MARTGRIKREGAANYHLMSRTNGKRFLFEKSEVKTALVDLLKRTAEFCGIKICAYAAMSNHFHVVCKVPDRVMPVTVCEIIRRVGVLKGRAAAEELSERWRGFAAAGHHATLESEVARYRARMGDISEFMKTFKESFSAWYKKNVGEYCGSIWSGRFKSTLIEDGEYLSVCKRYVVLNPVRAGMVTNADDYRWVWSENDEKEPSAGGSVPIGDEKLMKRVAQIGNGKILGSFEFVGKEIYRFGSCWRACPSAKPVFAEVYATHGFRKAA